MVRPESYWFPGESLDAEVERAAAASKVWNELRSLPPATLYENAYEAELFFFPAQPVLSRRGAVVLRAHEEASGEKFVLLYLGPFVLRRAHVGGSGHQEPANGPYIQGPHIHYPTTKFWNIGGRGSRSRAYSWSIPETTSLQNVVQLFAQHVNVLGQPRIIVERLN